MGRHDLLGLALLLPRLRPLPLAGLALLAATAVEFLKLLHTPALDAFRSTLPGILLLGRIFSFADLLAYLLAISLGALLDDRVLRRLARP